LAAEAGLAGVGPSALVVPVLPAKSGREARLRRVERRLRPSSQRKRRR
jgi:hypothetical protein